MKKLVNILLLICLSLVLAGCSFGKKEVVEERVLDIGVLLNDAKTLSSLGENDLAVNLCEYILSHSKDTDTYIKLFDYSNNKENAINTIEQIMANEINEEVIFYIGNFYLNIGDYAKAYYYFSMIQEISEIEQYKEIARILLNNPGSTDIEINLNNLLESIDKMEDSVEKITHYETLYNLFTSLEISQDISIKILDKMTTIAKSLYANNEYADYPSIELLVADVYDELATNNPELYKNALEHYQAYSEVVEVNKELDLKIASLLRKLEYTDQAITKYQELIAVYPDDIAVQCIYADMLLDIEFNKVDKSQRDFSQILGIYVNLKLKDNRYEVNEFIDFENRLKEQKLIE